MKKFVFGMVLFICGIMGCIGMYIAEAINWAGRGINIWEFFGRDGIDIPLIIFAAMTVIGLITVLCDLKILKSLKAYMSKLIND